MLVELDIVTLIEDRDDLALKAGAIGTIVMAHENADAYEVEFLNETGATLAVETLPGSQIRRVAEEEVEHVQ